MKQYAAVTKSSFGAQKADKAKRIVDDIRVILNENYTGPKTFPEILKYLKEVSSWIALVSYAPDGDFYKAIVMSAVNSYVNNPVDKPDFLYVSIPLPVLTEQGVKPKAISRSKNGTEYGQL